MLPQVPQVPGTHQDSEHHLCHLRILRSLILTGLPRGSFYVTSNTLSFNFLSQALLYISYIYFMILWRSKNTLLQKWFYPILCWAFAVSGRDDAWLSKESDFKVGQKCDYRYQVSFKYDKCKGSHSQQYCLHRSTGSMCAINWNSIEINLFSLE